MSPSVFDLQRLLDDNLTGNEKSDLKSCFSKQSNVKPNAKMSCFFFLNVMNWKKRRVHGEEAVSQAEKTDDRLLHCESKL